MLGGLSRRSVSLSEACSLKEVGLGFHVLEKAGQGGHLGRAPLKRTPFPSLG